MKLPKGAKMFYIKNKNDEVIEVKTTKEEAEKFLFFVDSPEDPHYIDSEN